MCILLDIFYRTVDKCTNMNNIKFIRYNFKYDSRCRPHEGFVVKDRVTAECQRKFPKTFLFVKITP